MKTSLLFGGWKCEAECASGMRKSEHDDGKSSAELFKNVKRIKSEFKILICSFALNLSLLLISRLKALRVKEEEKLFSPFIYGFSVSSRFSWQQPEQKKVSR